MSLVLSNKGKGMQSSSEQPLVGEERYVTTRITAAKETSCQAAMLFSFHRRRENFWRPKTCLRSEVYIIFKKLISCSVVLSFQI